MSACTLMTEFYRLDVSKDGTGSITDSSGDRIPVGRNLVAKLVDAFNENTDRFEVICEGLCEARST